MAMSGKELRKTYLEYFAEAKGAPHKVVPPAPLIPPDDPTLLFTSAGMVQFKRLYSGDIEPLPYTRATTCQPCLRAGGKGSDLENVGKTLRHHTLFEMLGNFSFGDYFKREAIRWAWDFVTNVMHLPNERLFPTIFEDDDEAEQIWKEEAAPVNPIVRLDASQNYWGPAGDTGACGPCSELCFFMGTDEELKQLRADIESGKLTTEQLGERIDQEGDLFLEIWNMVFPQFDQQRDGSRPPLKYRGIDTGAGLERMTTAMFRLEGRGATPYETDLLQPVVQAASEILGVKYVKVMEDTGNTEDERNRLAINAISDHARALCFCLEEGITPGNVGRGYVIRRIQRRALRFASLLGRDEPFMAELLDPVIESVGETYPGLKTRADFIRKALRIEEEAFLKTRNRGMKLLDELIEQAKQDNKSVIAGEDAFKLWDTYGFPVDLTEEVALDAGLKIDRPGYEASLKEQKERGKASWRGEALNVEADLVQSIASERGETEFTGYTDTVTEGCKVLAIIRDGGLVEKLTAGETGTVVLDKTPFYAESGGQVGDTGLIVQQSEELLGDVAGEVGKYTYNVVAESLYNRFNVEDTQKTAEGIRLHRGDLQAGELKVGDTVNAFVDEERRMAIRRNHSTTHLLQAALKKHLGDHVKQAGSYVGEEGLRFDFSHPEALDANTLRTVQDEVNRMILEDYPVSTEVLPLEEAKKKGALAVFGEKYGPTVRVVSMGREGNVPSMEFCGGTHLDHTGQAARFRIVSEGSIASGVRRVEAVTGERAADMELEDQYDVLAPLQGELATRGPALVERVHQLQQQVKALQKELASAKQKAAAANLDEYAAKAVEVGPARVATAVLENFDPKQLKTFAVSLQEKVGPNGVAVAFAKNEDKIAIVVASGEKVRDQFAAGKVINRVAKPLGGKGGGKPDIAQAGAKGADNFDDVVKQVPELVRGG